MPENYRVPHGYYIQKKQDFSKTMLKNIGMFLK